MNTEAQVSKVEVVPEALYSVREVAGILGLERINTIYEIPESELIPTRVGPRRGRKKFRGRDVIAYIDRGRRSAA